jgi:hypothetical protein
VELAARVALLEARIAAIEDRMAITRLGDATWTRTAAGVIECRIPTTDLPIEWRLMTLRSPRVCAVCGEPLAPGDPAYAPPRTRSQVMRAKRLCVPCAEAVE